MQGKKNKNAHAPEALAEGKRKKRRESDQEPRETKKERAWLVGVRHELEEAAAQLAEVNQKLSLKMEARKALRKEIRGLVREAGGLEAKSEALQAVISAWAPPTT